MFTFQRQLLTIWWILTIQLLYNWTGQASLRLARLKKTENLQGGGGGPYLIMFPLHTGQLQLTLPQCEGVSLLPPAVQAPLFSSQLIAVAQWNHLRTKCGSSQIDSFILIWTDHCIGNTHFWTHLHAPKQSCVVCVGVCVCMCACRQVSMCVSMLACVH